MTEASEDIGDQTKREDLRNLAIVAHVGKSKARETPFSAVNIVVSVVEETFNISKHLEICTLFRTTYLPLVLLDHFLWSPEIIAYYR